MNLEQQLETTKRELAEKINKASAKTLKEVKRIETEDPLMSWANTKDKAAKAIVEDKMFLIILKDQLSRKN